MRPRVSGLGLDTTETVTSMTTGLIELRFCVPNTKIGHSGDVLPSRTEYTKPNLNNTKTKQYKSKLT